jgi:hypothetical protein
MLELASQLGLTTTPAARNAFRPDLYFPNLGDHK